VASRALVAAVAFLILPTSAHAQQGNAARGARVYQACAPCHSLEPDRNMTGPSLSSLWGRAAGTLPSFTRYSQALKSSGIVWNNQTLDAWIANPQRVVHGNLMTFAGIADAAARADLLAYLRDATQPGSAAQRSAQGGMMGGMGGMMGGGAVPSLKKLDDEDRVQSIAYCRDTYEVATADGKKRQFWELNLRFKTDSSEDGPTRGAPALVGAGMLGDRADVIFAAPDEVSTFVKAGC
jgi:cytochrome c